MVSGNRNKEVKFKFSFVMPVYNVSKYLDETVNSILTQTLDFESNCQIIFVNDGSTDNSEEICLKYKSKYPDNIIYIKQSNQGVSSARNTGIKYAEGKYISFLDSDDVLSKDALDKVYDFFERNYDRIDIVAIKLEFFEALSGPHMLNYKFSSTRVIDIEEEYDCVQLSGGSTFVKRDAVQGRYSFDPILKYSEDVKFLTEIILDKGAYGVVSEPVYYYRRRHAKDSAISSSFADKSWYTDTPSRCYRYLLDYSKEKFGRIPRYVQYLVMYDLQWRMSQKSQNVLTSKEENEYKNTIFGILKDIEDDIVVAQRNIPGENKLFILQKKYEKKDLPLRKEGREYFINEAKLYDYDRRIEIHLEIVDIKNDTLGIEGRVRALLLPGTTVRFIVDNKPIYTTRVKRPQYSKMFLGEVLYEGVGFKVDIPIRYGSTVRAEIQLDNGLICPLSYVAGYHSRLLDFVGSPYRAYNGYLICQPNSKTLYIDKNTLLNRIKKEAKFILSYGDRAKVFVKDKIEKKRASVKGILSRKNIPTSVLRQGPYGRRGKPKPLSGKIRQNTIDLIPVLRLAYYITRPFMHKNIWIISDRVDAAGDNGEALFRYLSKTKPRDIDYYFTIKPTSSDYKRVKKFGKVINRDGWWYKVIFLHAKKIISSHADDFVINPYGHKQRFVRDLLKFDFVFLQHGITKDDISGWLNKYNKNIKMFVTASDRERESIIKGDYYYDKKVVRLTGFPRYDLLKNNPKNKIIIAPTWRRMLSNEIDSGTLLRPYNPEFKNSEYFQFYNKLLNDEGLNRLFKEKGIVGEFYLHPAHTVQLSDFSCGESFVIKDFPYSYSDAFSEGSLLITDYSSVAFDFAYLRKPIVYTQFDKSVFFDNHLYTEGYFSYENDGFGKVVYDYDSTIQEIARLIGRNFHLDTKYKTRIDSFYRYSDRSNSERVYKAILDMDE